MVTILIIAAGFAASALAAGGQTAKKSEYRRAEGVRRVHFAIYVMDIDEISAESQNFTVNVMVRLRWKDERLAHQGLEARTMPLMDVWEGYLLVTGQQALFRRAMPEDVDVEPDGTVIYRQQWSGPLSQPMSLADFPIDRQDFNIHFVATGYRRGEIEFVPDVIGGEEGEQIVGGMLGKELSLPDWRIQSTTFEARAIEIAGTLKVPGFAVTIMAKRVFAYYLWNVFIPLILITMMSWVPFWVDPARAEVQVGVASSTVLTLIAQRLVVSNLLPRLPYLTRMDYVLMVATVLVFAAFVQVSATSVLAYRKHHELAVKLDKVCRALFPATLFVTIALSLFL
jgi:hypothetical protein